MKRSKCEVHGKARDALDVRFEAQQLTAFSGLIIFQRLFAKLGLKEQLRHCFRHHEGVMGDMRGNIRAPEPRGFNQELIDPHDNPFPGADVVQPPTKDGENIRFHQVKSKTGSAKGGDGKRLGDQLRQLRQYYAGDVYYDALIGNTLRGHRSMRGVLSSEPAAIVLVGEAAFRELTRSSIGPELLLRVYQSAFSEAVPQTGYHIDAMAAGIVSTFHERAKAAGEGFPRAAAVQFHRRQLGPARQPHLSASNAPRTL